MPKCSNCGTEDPEEYCGQEDGLPHPTYRMGPPPDYSVIEPADGVAYAMPKHVGLCCECVDVLVYGKPTKCKE